MKKYPSLKGELSELISELELNPLSGVDLGSGFRKLRLAIKSKGSGKSGGARIITVLLDCSDDGEVGLLFIYDKSERSSISDRELKDLLKSCMSDDAEV